jgi:dCTP deaminase
VTFWTSERLHAEGATLVDPFDPDSVENCAIELKLGPEGYVTGGDAGKRTDLPADGKQLVIPPGQFALLLSEEKVSVPANAIGFISVRSRFKLHGLVNVSGFHVDPGFEGQLIFSVYNAGGTDVVVSRGERLFLLWLASLQDTTEDVYNGSRRNQSEIPNRDIIAIGREHYSPAKVNDRLTAVEIKLATAWRTAAALLIGILLALGALLVQRLDARSPENVVSPTPTVSQEPR